MTRFLSAPAGVVGLLVSWAAPAAAQMSLDYSGVLAPQAGGVASSFTLAPLSDFTFPDWNNPKAVGRFYGRLDVTPSYESGRSRSGLDFGLYSNLSSARTNPRGIVEFDRRNLELTRIKPETPLDFDRLRLFNESPYGRLEVGWGEGVSERQAVTAPLDWGLGSVGGDYPYFADKPIDIGFNTLSALGSANPSPRAAYFTPAIYGTVLGLSYQPDTRNTGFEFHHGDSELGLVGRRSNADVDLYQNGVPLGIKLAPLRPVNGSFEGYAAGFYDVVEAGVSTEQHLGPFWMKGSLAGIAGTAVPSPLHTPFRDLRSFQAGMQLGYAGWTIGGGYVGAGDSGYAVDAQWRQRKHQFSLHGGIQYETGPWTFGGAALLSDDAGDPMERSDRQLYVYSTGLRYQFARNLDVGAELDYIRALSADYGDRDVVMGLVQLRYRFDGSLGSTPYRHALEAEARP